MKVTHVGVKKCDSDLGVSSLKRHRRTIVHVAESYGGGVAAAIRDYCRNYPLADHHLIYAPRSDAPVDRTHMSDFSTVIELAPGHLRRISALRHHLSRHPESIIHAHSSFAGFYARAAIRKSASRPIIYTPHCYGFERRDVAIWKRVCYWGIEWLLAFNTSAFAACSKREEELSRWPLVSAKRLLVGNVPALDIGTGAAPALSDGATRVVGAGRLGPQKDPEFFRDCIVELRNSGFTVDPLWIGGGDQEVERMLHDGGIPTTGWLPRQSVLERLRDADIYIHSALWEGFPIAVLEASIVGVPIIARDIPAFAGVDMPLLIKSPAELTHLWPRLESLSVRREMVLAAAGALEEYNDQTQAIALASLYEGISVSRDSGSVFHDR